MNPETGLNTFQEPQRAVLEVLGQENLKYIKIHYRGNKITKLQTIKILLKKIGFKSRFKTVKRCCLTKLHW